MLLDLQASGRASSDDELVDDGPADSSFIVDEDRQLVFQDTVRDSLEEEVNAFVAEIEARNIRQMDGSFRCTLCPFRPFKGVGQLSDHVRMHHTKQNQFVCPGERQTRIILALYDADCAKDNGKWISCSEALSC